MGNKTLNIRIQLRNDTAENWTSKNPTLLKGEMGVEIDTGKTKIGDGVKTWRELTYSGVDEDTIKGIIDSNRGNITVVSTTESAGKEDSVILAGIEGKKDDKVIIEREISGDKISYTAYIHEGTAWAAMDGNYSADNVYFDKDLTYTANIGVLTVPSSGSGTIQASGKNVKEVLAGILAQEANPDKTNPAVSFSAQGGFGTVEIGTKRNLTYTAALSAGSYTYGPATGITAQSWEVSCTGVADKKTTATGTFENIVAEATAKKITAKATYGDGAIPVTNLGNAYAAGQIKAGSASKTSDSLVGVRYMFWGPMTTDTAIDSAAVRALAHNKATSTGALGTFGAGAGAKKVVVAIPSDRKIKQVLMPSALNADVTALFVKQSATVPVNGAEGYAAAAYNIYVYQPASIDAGETYTVTIG